MYVYPEYKFTANPILGSDLRVWERKTPCKTLESCGRTRHVQTVPGL